MKMRKFSPREILFSPTAACNLSCAHCDTERRRKKLPLKTALAFLRSSSRIGINRVSFTGGEPFLASGFLYALAKEAVRKKMLFGRITTNGVWFKTKKELISVLNRLFQCGYDGDLFISVDAFHSQDLKKVATFIKEAVKIWNRPDIISIVAVKGAKEKETLKKLLKLTSLLSARLIGLPGGNASIKNKNLFIKVFTIDLTAVGKAAAIKNAWDGKWFQDDFCSGPGNIFFVLADGTVKPCCGYATDSDMLTLGSIKRDSPEKLLRNAQKNRFLKGIFGSGFHPLRKRLLQAGVRFPGKTSNHCCFCYYLTYTLPRPLLKKYLP